MSDHEQEKHARIFGEAARAIAAAAVGFARQSAGVFTAMDCAKLYLVAGVTLATGAEGPAGAAATLRALANELEADRVKPN